MHKNLTKKTILWLLTSHILVALVLWHLSGHMHHMH